MNVLVTGGLGVNGQWVVRKLIDRGHRPVVLDRQLGLTPLGTPLAPVRERLRAVEGNVNDFVLLTRLLVEHDIEVIVHMAALLPEDCQRDPVGALEVNLLGTVRVLEAARITPVNRVVFLSSRAYYGPIEDEEHGDPNFMPIHEDHPPNPKSVYDISKVAAEQMGRYYRAQYGLEFVALRFGAIYGPGRRDRHGKLSLLSMIIEESYKGRPVAIRQGGQQRDDIIYVDDVAEAVVTATLREQLRFDAYNIATGRARSLAEFVEVVGRVIPSAEIAVGPGMDHFEFGSNYYGALDTTRAREDLGFEPRFSFEDGVRHYIAAHWG